MEANLASPARHESRGPAAQPSVVEVSLFAVNAIACLLGLVIFGRRVAGSLQSPAPVGLLLLAALLALALSWLTRRLWRHETRLRNVNCQQAAGLDVIVGWGPSIMVVLLTFGLSWPGGRFVDWLVWLPVWVADTLWRKAFLVGVPREPANAARLSGPDLVIPREAGAAFPLEANADLGDGVVLQRLTRFRDDRGRETIAGSLRAELAAGQRATELYVGFCPAFDRIPTIELEQSDGPPARVSVGHVLPHGARIDVRLLEPAAAVGEVHVELFAAG